MPTISHINFEKSDPLTTTEKICVSGLILLIIGIAATIFALQFHSHLLLPEKYVVPVLTSYSIGSAFLIIYLLSLLLQGNKNKAQEGQLEVESRFGGQVQVEPTEVKPEFVQQAQFEEEDVFSEESSDMQIEPSIDDPSLIPVVPFLDSERCNPLEALLEKPSLSQDVERLNLRKTARMKLKDAKKYSAPVDWKQFALMNNTHLIHDTAYEGHHTLKCYEAYLNYLYLLEQEGEFFSLGETKKALQELQAILTVSKTALSNVPRCVDGALDCRSLLLSVINLMKLITSELLHKGYFYFPVGYCGRSEDNSYGHALACKISLDRTTCFVTMSFLNLGEGAQYHPELSATTTNLKVSYSYYPAVLPFDKWIEIAPDFFLHLFRFISDLPHKATIYTSRDLYDLLDALQAHSINSIIDRGEKIAGKLQHVGDCPEKVVRNTVLDFLCIEKGLPAKEVDILFLNLHFGSIISAYYSLLQTPHAEHKELFINACEEYGHFLLRSKDLIPEEKYLEAAEMIDLMLRKIKPQTNSQTTPLVSIKTEVPTLFSFEASPTYLSIEEIHQGEAPVSKHVDLPVFNATTFKDDFGLFVKEITALYFEDNAIDNHWRDLFHVYLNTLPVPRWDTKDVWDTVPSSEIPSILQSFQSLIETRLSHLDTALHILSISLLYAITDKLVRRISHNEELKKAALPFPASKRSFFFLLGSEAKRFQQIKEYFNESKKAAQGAILPFPKKTLWTQLTTSSKDWSWLSQEMQTLFTLASICVKNAEGKTIALGKLHERDSWDKLKKDEYEWCMPPSLEKRLRQFLHKHKGFTANDILCEEIAYDCKQIEFRINNKFNKDRYAYLNQEWDKEKPSKEILDELTLILRQPKLQLGLVIQWLERHFTDLRYPIVQEMVELALFSGSLHTQVNKTPEVIDELRRLFEKGMKNCKPTLENFPILLFLITCGITLESYVAEFANLPINQSQLNRYKLQLNTLQSLVSVEGDRPDEDRDYVRILGIKKFLELFNDQRTEEGYIELYTEHFKHGIITYGYHSFGSKHAIYYRFNQFHYLFFQQFQAFLNQQINKQEVLNRICNCIMQTLIKSETEDLEWCLKGSGTRCFSKKYVFDFFSGSIKDAQTGHTLILPTQDDRIDETHKELGIPSDELWWMTYADCKTEKEEKEKHYTIKMTFDKSTVLILVGGAPLVLKAKGAFTSLAQFNDKDYDKLPFLKDFSLIHFFIKGKEGEKDRILSTHKVGQKPFMRIDFVEKKASVKRLDEEGNQLPYQLVNLENLSTTHPLHPYTIRFANHKDTLCFIHEETKEIEELYFTRFKLSFKQNAGKLESVEFPGYCWIPLEIKALKTHSRDAMVLRNASGQIKIILITPEEEIKKLSRSQNKEDSTNSSLFPEYFIFDLPNAEAPIVCKNASERLFLIYFFKTRNNYTAADEELKKLPLQACDVSSLKLLNLFFCLHDYSPLSLAFTQKILLFLTDHVHFIRGYKKQMKDLEIMSCLESGCKWYVNYLRAAGDDRINGIPIEWRLTEDEEFRILTLLDQEKIKLPKILKIRTELILSESRTAEFEFIPQEVSLVPKAFKNLRLPSKWEHITKHDPRNHLPYGAKSLGDHQDVWIQSPNQVSRTYCKRFFAELYIAARDVPPNLSFHPFDFTLLALLRNPPTKKYTWLTIKEHESFELASLLFYVRRFPDFFPRSLESRPFNELIQIACDLEKHEHGCAMLETFITNKQTLQYTKKIKLSLPPPPPDPQPLPESEPIKINPKPFEGCRRALFVASTGKSIYGKEKLFEESLLEDHPIEKEIVEKYQKAHLMLAQQDRTLYAFQPQNASQVKKDLKKLQNTYQCQMEKEKDCILQSANDPYQTFNGQITLAEEKEFRLRLNIHQTYTLTPEMIMKEAILKDSTQLFDEHRPMLRKQHIKAIVDAVNRFYHLQVLVSLCTEALVLLKQLKDTPEDRTVEQNLLNILNYEFLYSPEKYPEISYMHANTGKMPRKGQFLVYEWVCEGLERCENRQFQLEAGGGKTSYLIPLFILRAKRHGLNPVVLTTQSMYGVEKENLKNTLSLLDEELDTLEIDMNTELTIESLKRIHRQLISVFQQKKAMIITSQAYYALRLSFFTATTEGELEKSELLEKILNFFKKHVVVLGDESHRNYDPLTQAIYGLGHFHALEKQEQQLLMHLAKPLFGIEQLMCENGKPLSQLAQSKEKGKGKPNKEEMAIIKKELSTYIMRTFFKDIPQKEHAAIFQFWLQKTAAEPPYLAILSNDDQRRFLIHLGRHFFTSLLKQILKMKTDYDHVMSEGQGGIDTPSYNKNPSHAQFKDPCLTFLLSIKGTWYRGLNSQQFKNLIASLKKMDAAEKDLTLKVDSTPSLLRFEKWIGKEFPDVTLRNFDCADKKIYEPVFAFCRKKAAVLDYFLNECVLTHVGYTAEQFTSSPAHMMAGGKCSITFSATPLKDAYPKSVRQIKSDDLFEAQVIAQSAKSKNQNFIFPENIETFFAEISKDRTKYRDVRLMIDAGGFLCRLSNKEVAKKWLASSELDAVVYFQGSQEAYEEKLCIEIKKTNLRLKFSRMGELKSLLAAHNIDTDSLVIGYFFDSSHAESAHVDPIPNSAAFIFAGDLTLSHAIQAMMRARGFLNEAYNQWLIWVVQKDLKAKMQKKCPHFGTRIIHTWCLKNEVKAHKTRIILAAFQDIILKIEEYALLSEDNQRQAILKYAKGFRETVNPRTTWGSQKQMAKTDQVLWQFAEQFYENFDFNIPFEENQALHQAIEETIVETHQKIADIVASFDKTSSSQMHQRSIVKQKMRTLQYPHQVRDVKPEPIYLHQLIDHKDYPQLMKKNAWLARDIFQCDHLTDHFYIEANQIYTAKSNAVQLKEKFLKTIDYLLIIIHNGSWVAEAVSNDLLPKYIKILKSNCSDQDIQHQAFIIRADGVLYYRGTGALRPSESTIAEIMGSQWMQDVLIDTALLKGKILYSKRFKERVRQWPNFLEFWSKILTALPLKKDIKISALASYLPADLAKQLN